MGWECRRKSAYRIGFGLDAACLKWHSEVSAPSSNSIHCSPCSRFAVCRASPFLASSLPSPGGWFFVLRLLLLNIIFRLTSSPLSLHISLSPAFIVCFSLSILQSHHFFVWTDRSVAFRYRPIATCCTWPLVVPGVACSFPWYLFHSPAAVLSRNLNAIFSCHVICPQSSALFVGIIFLFSSYLRPASSSSSSPSWSPSLSSSSSSSSSSASPWLIHLTVDASTSQVSQSSSHQTKKSATWKLTRSVNFRTRKQTPQQELSDSDPGFLTQTQAFEKFF